jgi:hypothetical protein
VAGASPFRFLCRMTLRGWLGFSYAAGMRRVACLSTFFLLLVSAASAQKVENLGAFSGEASEKIKAAIGATGYRVFLPNTLAACDLWLAKDVAGVITFPKGGGHDFRGQTVRPGTYTMRYQLLPSDGNHLGVAPNPDFVLLTSVFEDTDPSANYDFGKLVEMSSGAAHSSHPAAFEMMPPETGEPHAAQTDDGWIVLQAPVTTKEGKKMMVGIVVKGSAAQ